MRLRLRLPWKKETTALSDEDRRQGILAELRLKAKSDPGLRVFDSGPWLWERRFDSSDQEPPYHMRVVRQAKRYKTGRILIRRDLAIEFVHETRFLPNFAS